MPKTSDNYFNFVVVIKDKEGKETLKKCYRSTKDIAKDLPQYKESTIKNRCSDTAKGKVKSGLLIYRVKIPLDDPSIYLINKLNI